LASSFFPSISEGDSLIREKGGTMPRVKSAEGPEKRREKIGVLLVIEGFGEVYRFDSIAGYLDHLFPLFPKGFFAGGPKEGKTCYTLIHYANREEAEICGVPEGTPIDAFGEEYRGTYPVHSLLDHLPPDDPSESFYTDCYPDLLVAMMLTHGHSTVDPVTGEKILGPHVDDPEGSGIGIADFVEMVGLEYMERYYHFPDKKLPNTRQFLEWWHGKDIPDRHGYSPSPQELTNVKDALEKAMPGYDFVFRAGRECFMENQDLYGNPKRIEDSVETALEELIHAEAVNRIVVMSCGVSGSNIIGYGPQWYDKNSQGVSAIPGKTFKECVEDLTNGLGPTTQEDLDEYLASRPWHMNKPCFPQVKEMVEQIDPKVKLTFTRPIAEFEGFELAVLDILNYTVAKYNIPRTAALRVVLAEHGMSGGWKEVYECDCSSRTTSDLFNRLIARIKANFSWAGTLEVVPGKNEFSEAEDDPVSEDKPFGDVWSVGERIDSGINGQYVNELGAAVDNGTHNFDYIIVIPVFSLTDVFDTLCELRETLGNNVFGIVKGQAMYKRDEMDREGVPHYDAKNFDNEYFTVKAFNATDCPSIPGGMEDADYETKNPTIYKGSSAKPTTVIITSTVLSLGNGPARTHLTEAAVEAIIEACKD
jgi:hypothetical protein